MNQVTEIHKNNSSYKINHLVLISYINWIKYILVIIFVGSMQVKENNNIRRKFVYIYIYFT